MPLLPEEKSDLENIRHELLEFANRVHDMHEANASTATAKLESSLAELADNLEYAANDVRDVLRHWAD
ncbi:hypothetical protein MUN82_04065 [Hymenobacter aerilatus]|uniref:Uncharacterized protein n=1 Tax=Hymenobacter aerilatus TaxID=2932251 RepID=A0A8T9SWS3_9BACT|nr:hypothetical protein [Hymenobacter aerilatus]UOR06275.1 hypothetical protein MUN82_04065 [Hymenobacter aerilatus]